MEKQEDPEESPKELASIYKCETFETSEAVLEGARHIVCHKSYYLLLHISKIHSELVC